MIDPEIEELYALRPKTLAKLEKLLSDLQQEHEHCVMVCFTRRTGLYEKIPLIFDPTQFIYELDYQPHKHKHREYALDINEYDR